MKIGISAGTASALGFIKSRCDCPPETAYLIIGDKCSNSCSFCSRGNPQSGNMLSRVTWPKYDFEEAITKIKNAYDDKKLKRVCFQTVSQPDINELLRRFIIEVRKLSDIPISASISSLSLKDIQKIFDAGADNISLPIDCASKTLFQKIKKKNYQKVIASIKQAALAYPKRIATHIIAGLGETEEEMASCLSEINSLGVNIGLFAFTPIPHSEMASYPPPSLRYYRKIQILKRLVETGRPDVFYIKEGIIYFSEKIYNLLEQTKNKGAIFQTSGCAGCNRPYYNERPGNIPYNYPRKPSEAEVENALKTALGNIWQPNI